jgi:hypothetical protein
MHRTQVLFEERQYRFLHSLAKREGKSLSALLREIVDKHINSQPQSTDPLSEILGMAEGEPAPIGRDHDKYLYGRKQ